MIKLCNYLTQFRDSDLSTSIIAQLTTVIFPVKSVNEKPCSLEEGWISVERILMQIARIVVHHKPWSC